MQCTNPVWLTSDNLHVPCGKCMACRIARARDWTVRMIHEQTYHTHSTFLTLTLDDTKTTQTYSLDKSILVSFVKRLRKALQPRIIKYYACGEYGEERGRPHYHAIIFGLSRSEQDRKTTDEAWGLGKIYYKGVGYDSCRYVADYIQKKYSGKMAISQYGDKLPPFQLQSLGIGKQFCLDNRKYLTDKLGCTVNGREVGLPRYYQKILDIDPQRYIDQAKEHELQIQEHWDNNWPINEIKEARKQHNLNLVTKTHLVKKGKL